jgi:hypothetical protein
VLAAPVHARDRDQRRAGRRLSTVRMTNMLRDLR